MTSRSGWPEARRFRLRPSTALFRLILAGPVVEAGLVLGLPVGLAYGVAFVLATGFGLALTLGLTPWLYHYWLRHRLAGKGVCRNGCSRFLSGVHCSNEGGCRYRTPASFGTGNYWTIWLQRQKPTGKGRATRSRYFSTMASVRADTC